MERPRVKKSEVSRLAVQGNNFAPPGKKEALLQTLNKLEKDAENRAFEVINLRVRGA
jgi:hypothetical protein